MTGVTKDSLTFNLGTIEIQDKEKEKVKKIQEFECGNNVGYIELL
jgi:hypothetical protein